ncbi:gtpase activating protein [Coniochaeta hoffmannii]|uniref:Gtpase activating protein n=1 Tax=Coniochaeta hoffmannii TaxID=91930 RepID=A0AA38VUX0_9PEZI|nr:gtpase activating protein [Coniochaeta hoffmannii]
MSLAASTPLQSSQPAPVPRLAEPLEDAQNGSGDETPRASATTDATTGEKIDPKKKKRSLFGFGKKKTDDGSPALKSPSQDESSAAPASTTTPTTTSNANTTTRNTSSPPSGPPTRRTTASPINIEATHMLPPSSPGRNMSSSPRMASPAGSQIFERDVQESSAALLPNSPAIPSHIKTEDYIPPALDATSEAITDDHLDPDSVEIITHKEHQTAAFTLQSEAAMSSSHLDSSSWADELANSFSGRGEHGLGVQDNASNYGSLENTADVRRLSFISFADVVQAEQGPPASNHRDSMHLAGLTSLPSPSYPVAGVGGGMSAMSSSLGNRSPSPIRSPVSSSAGGPSPPTSKSGSVKGLEMSPARKPLGSPMSGHHNIPSLGGELNVETMTQALRRTASGDLGGSNRSLPTSPVEGPSR